MARYTDRTHAGRELSALLRDRYAGTDALVLALPRGGVPVAFEVAQSLHAELDIVFVRKVGLPHQPELAMGAIASVAGAIETVQNADILDLLPRLGLTSDAFARVAEAEKAELERRQVAYRGQRPPVRIEGRTVILVDDGLATGATMRAAVAAVRAENPGRIVVAVPIALSASAEELATAADEVVCAWNPRALLAVGQAYDRFDQVPDDDVLRILDTAWKGRAGG
jgi:putative phosphoribosyl transferase